MLFQLVQVIYFCSVHQTQLLTAPWEQHMVMEDKSVLRAQDYMFQSHYGER